MKTGKEIYQAIHEQSCVVKDLTKAVASHSLQGNARAAFVLDTELANAKAELAKLEDEWHLQVATESIEDEHECQVVHATETPIPVAHETDDEYHNDRQRIYMLAEILRLDRISPTVQAEANDLLLETLARMGNYDNESGEPL